VERARGGTWRRFLPWGISLAALVYVFGYATDWGQLVEATGDANLPLFLFITVVDKLAFFFVWALLQAEAIRRFVAPVPRRSILAIRGGSELFRAISNPLADASFLLGVTRLTTSRVDAVVVVALIPFVTHLLVLLAQITLVLPFLGTSGNGVVYVTAGLGWALVGASAVGLMLAPAARIPGLSRIVHWLRQVRVRQLAPFFVSFALLAAFDVLIQGAASRAFGIVIPWTDLAARIPVLYAALSIPSVGNFGVREFAWAGLFAEFGSQDSLFAYAFATNSIFLLLNVLIGVCFLRRAFELIADIRSTRERGETVPEPILHDAMDP